MTAGDRTCRTDDVFWARLFPIYLLPAAWTYSVDHTRSMTHVYWLKSCVAVGPGVAGWSRGHIGSNSCSLSTSWGWAGGFAAERASAATKVTNSLPGLRVTRFQDISLPTGLQGVLRLSCTRIDRVSCPIHGIWRDTLFMFSKRDEQSNLGQS